MSGIEVVYIYSACVIIKTPDVSVLCDPWFTEGVFDGGWYQYPRVENPLASLGDVDRIYISHIHPDHYDPDFLRAYFDRFGVKDLLISDHKPNFLERRMTADGFTPTVIPEESGIRIGGTTLEIMPHKTGSISDIDSALIVAHVDGSDRRHCVVNANDIIFDAPSRAQLKQRSGDVDILLCGYTGAGPYPQTYFDADDPELAVEAEKKKTALFVRYRELVEQMQAKVNIPFAGKYILGGKLSGLNFHRGVADPVEVLAFDPHAVVLADNGGAISTVDLKPTEERTRPYPRADIEARIADIAGVLQDYERLINIEEIHQIPMMRLITTAYRNALPRSELNEDYFFAFPVGGRLVTVNCNRSSQGTVKVFDEPGDIPTPRSVIDIDPRYLFGLLTGIYHWNNAGLGSQFNVRRTPNIYNIQAQRFLIFFAV